MEKIEKKTIKKIIFIALSVLVLIGAAVAIAVVPTAIVSEQFGEIFDAAEDMAEPNMVITDMGAENNLPGAKGEMLIVGEAALHMIDQLADVSDGMEYSGKENAEGSFDIRYKITEGETTLEFYLTEEGMYYVKNGKKYVFLPEDEDTKVELKQIYNTACMFVK